MEDLFLSDIFDLALAPFTSNSLIVWIPAGFAFIYGCVSIVTYFTRRV